MGFQFWASFSARAAPYLVSKNFSSSFFFFLFFLSPTNSFRVRLEVAY